MITLNAGVVDLTYLDLATGCSVIAPDAVTVLPEPVIVFAGPDHICVGGTTQLSPSTGGVWTSDDDAVATINNAGLVVGNSPGTVSFAYVDIENGCSAVSSALTVNLPPEVAIDQNTVCLGETTLVTPSSGGVWTSSDFTICTVTNGGVVTTIGPGTCALVFSMNGNACPSDPVSLEVLPLEDPDCIVATENELDQKSYHLYPVPAQDILYISGIEERATFKVYDLEGRLLNTAFDVKNSSIDIRALKSGLYILTIRANDGSLSNKKFIKL